VSYAVDFVNVSTVGLESSPVAAALAGLRAHEARYFKNKYDQVFTVEPAMCVVRLKTDSDSGGKRTPVPGDSGQVFRLKADTA
jgi:hypothetical protein